MFNFQLAKTRNAKKPAENREDAKLMVVHRNTMTTKVLNRCFIYSRSPSTINALMSDNF